jgi:hypothetical protein
MRKHKPPPDWNGRVFGRLTVVQFHGISELGKRKWRCRCVCDREVVCLAEALASGNTQSCGCLRDENRRKRKGIKLPQLSIGYGLAARNSVIAWYRVHAKEGGRTWNLTTEEAERLFQSRCHYCGISPSQVCTSSKLNGSYTYNGIDRVDSSKGYEISNVVPCCRQCNWAKNDTPYDEFLDWVERVSRNQRLSAGGLRAS